MYRIAGERLPLLVGYHSLTASVQNQVANIRHQTGLRLHLGSILFINFLPNHAVNTFVCTFAIRPKQNTQLSKERRNEQGIYAPPRVGKQDRSLVGLQQSDELTVAAEGQRRVQRNIVNPH